MTAFNKFLVFVQDIGREVHQLNSDTLKVMLTNVAPVNTNTIKANLTDISAGNGYTAGGTAVASTAYAQTAGLAKLTGTDVVFTAAGGSMAAFRYAVLYNDTAANDPLIGWWDYGAEVTLTTGVSFYVDFDATNGILTLE